MWMLHQRFRHVFRGRRWLGRVVPFRVVIVSSGDMPEALFDVPLTVDPWMVDSGFPDPVGWYRPSDLPIYVRDTSRDETLGES